MASIPILSRLLSPSDFGLIAMVMVITGLARMFVDSGLSISTVQRDAITRQQVSNLFWIAAALGVLVGLVVAALAPAVAWFYDEPRLVSITVALSVSFVFSGLSIQHNALLRRAMQFKHIAGVQIAAVTLAQAAAVVWAWWYGTYWALVIAPILSSAVTMMLTWWFVGWIPSLFRRGAGTRPLVNLGASLTGASFIGYLARNGDNLLIGWYWGATPLGFYERAYRLLLLPLGQVMAPISSVAVPVLSRLKNDPQRYRNYFRTGVHLSSTVLLPVVVFTAVMPYEIVITVLGQKWADAAPIFLALVPAALVSTTAAASGWIFLSWGHVNRLLIGVTINTCIVLTSFAVTVSHGPLALALGYSITQTVIRVPYILYCFGPTPLRLRDQFVPMARPATAACVAAAAVLGAKALGSMAPEPYWRLLIGIGLFALFYCAAWVSLPGGLAALTQLRRRVAFENAFLPPG